jgi:tRNA A64-2'-O-ribosylphosphate transferase
MGRISGCKLRHMFILLILTLNKRSSYALPRLPFPLHPLWITPSSSTFPKVLPASEVGFLPVLCVSASKQVFKGIERRASGYTYVQGAGDDHELWGMVRSGALFWIVGYNGI